LASKKAYNLVIDSIHSLRWRNETKVPERIFVSGPITPRDCTLTEAPQIEQRNVDRVIEVAVTLIDKGHFVYVPHFDHFLYIHYSCKKDYGAWYYEKDYTFLDYWATALFFIRPGPGTNKELDRAMASNLKIYYDLEDVPEVRTNAK